MKRVKWARRMPNDRYGTKVERLAHDDHLTTRQSEIVGVGPLTPNPYSTGTADMGTVGAAARLGRCGPPSSDRWAE